MSDEIETPLRLNVGAGGWDIPGFIPIDRRIGKEAWPLDYPDNSVDEIRASHVLEHASHRDTAAILADWVRVLKPGGILRIAVPDIDRAYALRAQGDPRIEAYIMGGHVDENDVHGALFDEPATRELMRAAGLRQIRPWKSEIADCASLPVSLNLMGVKRGPVDVSGIIPVMTAPRLGFTDHYRVAQRAFTRLRMNDPDVTGGAFWCQGLTHAIEGAIAKGARYVLTLDYDSIFGPEQVEDLVWLADQTHADAVCALQVRRSTNQMLFCLKDADGGWKQSATLADFEPETVVLKTGHFGLTLIRADAFGKIAKPWFHGIPDPDGGWAVGKCTDSDSHFWQLFEEAGLTLLGAPHVVIGHAQLVFSYPGRDCRPIHVYPEDFHGKGVPANAWR